MALSLWRWCSMIITATTLAITASLGAFFVALSRVADWRKRF